MTTEWSVSSTYLTALGRAAARQLAFPVGASFSELVTAPYRAAWWPGTEVMNVFDFLVAAAGSTEAERLAYLASRDGMGPIVHPLATLLLKTTSSPAHALFSRVEDFVQAGVRGVGVSYTASPKGCTLHFRFPSPVRPVASLLWKGMVAVGFELAGGGKMIGTELSDSAHTCRIEFG